MHACMHACMHATWQSRPAEEGDDGHPCDPPEASPISSKYPAVSSSYPISGVIQRISLIFSYQIPYQISLNIRLIPV